MIYRQTKHSLQTDEAQRGINFILYLKSETLFLLKSLLVIQYTKKKKKLYHREKLVR